MDEKPKPTVLHHDELVAFRKYAACHGKDWRKKLMDDWMRAETRCPNCRPFYHTLQAMRNHFAGTGRGMREQLDEVEV